MRRTGVKPVTIGKKTDIDPTVHSAPGHAIQKNLITILFHTKRCLEELMKVQLILVFCKLVSGGKDIHTWAVRFDIKATTFPQHFSDLYGWSKIFV